MRHPWTIANFAIESNTLKLHIAMKRHIIVIFGIIMSIITMGCSGNATHRESTDETTAIEPSTQLTPCDITVGGVRFTKAKNHLSGKIEANDSTLAFTAEGHTDFFRSPDGTVVNNSPAIFIEVDNTRPFTFTAKVHPQFTPTGTYSAGVLYAYVDDLHSQKLCFEQDEYGDHRVVSVRTIGTSDDNNHQSIPGDTVYMRMSSDGTTFGSYYSVDGKEWHMARLYKNDFPGKILIGLSSQSPKDDGHLCVFSEVTLVDRATVDFRNGKLAGE